MSKSIEERRVEGMDKEQLWCGLRTRNKSEIEKFNFRSHDGLDDARKELLELRNVKLNQCQCIRANKLRNNRKRKSAGKRLCSAVRARKVLRKSFEFSWLAAM
jgi:hypothetical protein